jgi:GTP diphosphokinase / guanosine-3',5'-bis(diphosphate) 3'-diphosphatase
METATALLARQAERLGIVTEDGDPLTILLERVKRIRPTADLELIEHAYHFADWAHSGQTRLSGEPYITHPWNVALIVADMGLDDPSIAAALLHDVVEDTEVEMATIVQEFGEEVARLVEGVTKLRRLQFHTLKARAS